MRSPLRPLFAGYVVSLLSALVLVSPAAQFLNPHREQFFDALTQFVPAPLSPQIIVVDIGNEPASLVTGKAFDRSDLANLLTKISEGPPLAVAIDIVFVDHCGSSEVENQVLASAIAAAPTTLGFLLAAEGAQKLRRAPPVAVRRPFTIPASWFIDGADTSCDEFQKASRSASAAFLIGDADGRVRRVQPYSILDGEAFPALAIEAVKAALGDGPPIIGGEPGRLMLDKQIIALDDDGNFRFAPSSAAAMAGRTVSASQVLKGELNPRHFNGKIVFIGSSLPQFGGLRPTASMPLEPSVQIHADIANGLITGFLPERDARLQIIEAFVVLAGGALLASIATRTQPVAAAILGLSMIIVVIAIAVCTYAMTSRLIDVIGIVLALITVFVLTGIFQATRIRNAEALTRRRFAQYLPQSVVAQYTDTDRRAGLVSQERCVTALFTDIEGFTSLSQKLTPRDLVLLLNTYYTEVNALIASHGGMVEKIVGDAVHALFNAPEDLDNHVNKALACADEIIELTEEMRTRPIFASLEFGRTRIGIETGTALLGEVGTGHKLDYTAHGDVINMASRLQEVNKLLGTSICVGPEAAVQSEQPLRFLGEHEIRDFGAIKLFTTQAAKESLRSAN